MQTWEQLSHRDQLISIYSDVYKDAYGCRPRGMNFAGETDQMIEQHINHLSEIVARQESEREAAEQAAAERFEKRVAQTIEAGAGDRETALRWIHEAEGTAGDAEYLCYRLGLPYNYFQKAA